MVYMHRHAESTVIPAQAGIHADHAQMAHGFPLSRE
jgi:hypothetical protein